jgi:hypothetical protein
VAPVGCAPWLERPFAGLRPQREAAAACAGGRALRMGELVLRDAVGIGPLLFFGLGREHPASRFARPGRYAPGRAGVRPLPVLVVVPPLTRATVAISPADRDVAGLLSGAEAAGLAAPADAHRTLVCVAGPGQQTFEVAFVVDGARCLPVSVRSGGRTDTVRVRFGVRRCTR